MSRPSFYASVGFSTTGKGNKISVSTESMANANDMLFGGSERTDTIQRVSASTDAGRVSNSARSPSVSFSTAVSDKSISISAESMTKANKLFDQSLE